MHKLATAQLIQYKAGIKLQKTEGYIQTNHPFATYKITDRVEATMNKYEQVHTTSPFQVIFSILVVLIYRSSGFESGNYHSM